MPAVPGAATRVKLETLANGERLAAWLQYDAGRWRLHAASFSAGSWVAPFLVTPGDVGDFDLASNGAAFMIAWSPPFRPSSNAGAPPPTAGRRGSGSRPSSAPVRVKR